MESLIIFFVTIVSVTVITFYSLAYFTFNWTISKNPSDWGVFGDFFGGILNPLIAIAALITLIRAVKLQKSEFLATRNHLENEAKKNELYRLISGLEQKIESHLQIEVKNDAGEEVLTFGPLNQFLKPGWAPPNKTFVSLGNSNLCTSLKDYSAQILNLILKLEDLLKEYDSLSGGESVVAQHFMGLYQKTKEACQDLIGESKVG
jgi:uncharacterized membrane protein